MVVWWHKLGEVENECTTHNFSLFVIFLPKLIKIGGNLTKVWQKQFCTVFLRQRVNIIILYILNFSVYINQNNMESASARRAQDPQAR